MSSTTTLHIVLEICAYHDFKPVAYDVGIRSSFRYSHAQSSESLNTAHDWCTLMPFSINPSWSTLPALNNLVDVADRV